ncbi:lysophospholipase catalytic domain-containing protein [Pyrenochaeta sp. MPI-SDFR-AT-0127]|nr:lysophospholipase catalytic domain-containing protein [Pyrenochaeta sp. MPI-SDFR-AT-0127]
MAQNAFLNRENAWVSTILVCVLALFAGFATARISSPTNVQSPYGVGAFTKREGDNDSDGYVPQSSDCLNARPTIRNATSLSLEEIGWLEKRRANTVWAIRDFLARVNFSDFDTNAYIESISQNISALPNVAIAVSGGGYRALMHGAGVISAFDNQTQNSTLPGHVGGLLQASTYLSGLSGGSWLIGSLYIPKLKSVQEIFTMNPNDATSLWQLDNSIIKGPTALSTSSYYTTIMDEVDSKDAAGFNTTITDLWGRGLSFQLFNASDGGPGYTFSDIARDLDFQSASAPLPIVLALERAPNQLLIPSNSTSYEINPWEFGTFDPPTAAFAPLQYVGSKFRAGVLPDTERCVSGFDNAGFVVGTSSSLFNQAYLQINKTDIPPRVQDYLTEKLEEIGNENNDVSNWVNPFYQYNEQQSSNANSTALYLVDGGEDLQNIPLYPLLQSPRQVDVIFAVDSSADTGAPGAYWPNGTALVATYQRSLLKTGHTVSFPSIPDQNTFVNLGLNSQPTFFGCDTKNLTELSPLIVYIPNQPFTYNSNISTFQLTTNDTERDSIIQNGYNVATRGNGTLDKDWPSCIGCAVLSRSFERNAVKPPAICSQCFQRYCWNGTVNSTAPPPFAPSHAIKTSSCPRGAEGDYPFIVALCLLSLLLSF